ncbi:MAG: MMPL family transporter [Gammaproteobacteria bacterium]
MLAQLLAGLVHRRGITLAGLALPALLALDVLLDDGHLAVPLDPTIAALLPASGTALDRYHALRRRFGDDDVLVVTWAHPELFTPPRLARLHELATTLGQLPGVARVTSLADTPRIATVDGLTEIGGALDPLPADTAAARALGETTAADPLAGGILVARDASATAVLVEPLAGLDDAARFALLEAVTARSRALAGDVDDAVTGPLAARLALARALFHDLRRVLPLAVAATALVAAIALGSVRGVVLPLAASLYGLLLTLAAFVGAGQTLNLVSAILPPAVYVIGFAYAVHVVAAFERLRDDGRSARDAAAAAIGELVVPLSLTALTTAIGFLALATSNLAAIRSFGLFAALGTVLGWAAALTVVPLGLGLTRGRPRGRDADDKVTRVACALARFDIGHRRAILVGGGLLGVLALAAASRLEVSTNYLDVFPHDSAVRQDFAAYDSAFAGAVPLAVVVETDVPRAFADPAQLAMIADLETWLAAQPEIGAVTSLVDYVRLLATAFAPEAPATAGVPDSPALLDQLLLLGGGAALARLVDPHYGATRLGIQSHAVETGALTTLTRRIEARLAALPPHLRGHVTGSSVLVAATVDDVARGQVSSLLAAAIAIWLVLAALFESWRIGALALLPNALPIVAYFGILGLSGIGLNLTTSLVASVVLGIAVDDTIHLLARFNDEARRTAHEIRGLERALVTVVRPVTLTTAALCAGFLAFLTSELDNQVEFGLLAAATLFLAWLADLVFTPALAARLRFVTLWETLTLDLGCAAPQEAIPLFHGLSAREARIVALFGRLEDHPAGARVLAAGTPGHELRVVIDGRLRASVPHAGGATELDPLGRGDVVGGVALFEGSHTVDVDALTPVRLLNLDAACLERIRSRYPRIGARLYRNLGASLATRLARLSTRV